MVKLTFEVDGKVGDAFSINHLLDNNGYKHKYGLLQNSEYDDNGYVITPATLVYVICSKDDEIGITELINNYLSSITTE